MNDNEEIMSLYSGSTTKKKRHNYSNNNYRNSKSNQKNNKSYVVVILLIISIFQFLYIIYLLLKSKSNFKNNENNYYNEFDDGINENKPEDNISESEENINKLNFGKLQFQKEEYETNKSLIHIAMACDNDKGAIYSTLVSMTSALENNNKEQNLLVYHLLLSNNFDMRKISYFESLKNDYDFILNYFKIPPVFKFIHKKWKNTDTVEYKLLLSLIYPDIPRIIFLDGDTLIFTDISEMYNLEFNDNYLLGYPYHTADSLDKWDPDNFKIYVNGGVLLFNIHKIRKDNMDLKLLLFHGVNYTRTNFFEQDSLNYIYKNKIGLLPLKYGVYLFGNIEEYKKEYLYKMRIDINLTELENAIEKPSIVHLCCCNPKVWYKSTRQEKGFNHICERFQKEFYFYANKTKYYKEIYNTYMN
jgi:lipopolysaccharide biosynthesis glycosyltransferase